MDRIYANPNQPRKIFCDEAIEELSGSIKEYGVLQPIILKAGGDKYTIIAGERRYRAATMAGLKEIPAIIKTWRIRRQPLYHWLKIFSGRI